MLDGEFDRLMVSPGSSAGLERRPTDETFGWAKDDARDELVDVVAEIAFVQKRLMAEASQSLLVVIQGRDASGKDGLVRHVMTGLNPAGVRVVNFKVPAGNERFHDYLWRCHAACPAHGEVGVWNRSHYEDILVPRVKALVPEETWKRRYRHIREFERMLIEERTTIVKLYLHVSHDVQRKRLQKRIDDPESGWKHDPSDLTDRELWPEYERAYEELLAETSQPGAPWWVIPADVKWARDLVVARLLLVTLRRMDPRIPEPRHSLEGTVVE